MTAELIDIKALERIANTEGALFPDGDVNDMVEHLNDMRRARGVEPEAVSELALVVTEQILLMMLQGAPLEPAILSVFMTGFDMGLAAGIEAETRRQASDALDRWDDNGGAL